MCFVLTLEYNNNLYCWNTAINFFYQKTPLILFIPKAETLGGKTAYPDTVLCSSALFYHLILTTS